MDTNKDGIRIADISFNFSDYPDPINDCLTIYVSGCSHGCRGCHSKEITDFMSGKLMSVDELIKIIEDYASIYIEKGIYSDGIFPVCFSGGDPLHPNNIQQVKRILMTLNSNIHVCIYTGYELDYVIENNVSGFTFLKTGVFDITKKQEPIKTNEFMRFASYNQKLYNSELQLITDGYGKYFFK